MTFDELYFGLLEESASGKPLSGKYAADERQLDCLFHPENYPAVIPIKNCSCSSGEAECCAACLFDAIIRDDSGSIRIDPERCSGCSACMEACKSGVLTARRDLLPVLWSVKNAKGPVYALIAPSFYGQFSGNVTPGKLRSAFREIGFSGMIETALFADILTLKEALDFSKNVTSLSDFQLTSCCCPVWISLIRKQSPDLVRHIPGSVSPMIAAGRAVKALCPDAVTVFIGPCVAKKTEAIQPDLKGAVDHVLTFREIMDLFSVVGLNPENLEDAQKDHSSASGRRYAYAGGVSRAVMETFLHLRPNPKIPFRYKIASGISACKEMLQQLQSGKAEENFFEGMGCVGGCVGGPHTVLSTEEGKTNVDRYASLACDQTPLENSYVPKILTLLGFSSVEEFLENGDIFDRDLSYSDKKFDNAEKDQQPS